MDNSLTVKVREIIAAHLGVECDRLTDETRFRDDLRADWLDRLELMIAIEDQVIGIEIDEFIIDHIDTVGDLMRVIECVKNGGAIGDGGPSRNSLNGPPSAVSDIWPKAQWSCKGRLGLLM
jgi:acyl carrier protein